MNDQPIPPPAEQMGELKQLTILFADLAGSTALCEGLTPEQVHDLINAWVKVITEQIYAQGGIVTEFAGDAVMAIFGAPIAYEDSPQRACRAGLDMQRVLREFNKERRVPLQMRIGIDTGESFVGDVGNEQRKEYTALGHRANLAKRVQEVAERGSVTVSSETHQLIAPYFRTVEAGEFSAKGLSKPLRVFRVLGEVRDKSRLEVTLARWRAPLIGRDEPRAALGGLLEKMRAGKPQFVLVEGEPGIGKSRLTLELKEMAGATGAAVWEGRTQAYGDKRPFALIADMIRRRCGIEEDDAEEAAREKANRTAACLGGDAVFVEALLSPDSGDRLLRHLDPEARKAGLFSAVRRLVRDSAARSPLILVLDDFHWADPLSRELTEFIADGASGLPLMIVLVARPASVQLQKQARFATLHLRSLSPAESARLIAALLQIEREDESTRTLYEWVHRASGGNPLFVEEVLQALVAQGSLVRDGERWTVAEGLERVFIPGSLQDLIAARVDRLEAGAKELLQHAAVIGERFDANLLARIAGNGDVRARLGELAGHEFVAAAERGDEWFFKHGITWQVAYNTVPRSRRAPVHEQVAHAIEQLYAGRLEPQYELLAHHYGQSPDTAQALEYLRLSARKARRSFANDSAVAQYALAIEKAALLGMPLEEAALLVERGEVRASFLGQYDAAAADFDRAAELACAAGDPTAAARAWMGKGSSFIFQYRADEALGCLEQVLDATRGGTAPEYVEALIKKGFVLADKGDADASFACLQEALRLSRERRDDRNEIQSLINLGKLFFNTMRIDEALAVYAQCIERCREVGDKALLGLTLQNLAIAYGLGVKGPEHWQKAVEVNRELQKLLAEIGDKRRLANSYFNVAFALGWLGQDEQAAADCEAGLRSFRELGITFWEKRCLMLLRAVYSRLGRHQDHVRDLEELIQIIEAEGDHAEAADAWKDLGEARVATSDPGGAREAFFAAARHYVDLRDATAALACLQRVKDLAASN